MSGSYCKIGKRKDSKNKLLNGKFHNTRSVGKNQKQDGRTSSAGTHHRSQEYEDWRDEQKTEKNGVFLFRRPWPGIGAVTPQREWKVKQMSLCLGKAVGE